MKNVIVGRYSAEGAASHGWAGWIEPEDLSWIVFIPVEGDPVLFSERSSETGAVLSNAVGH